MLRPQARSGKFASAAPRKLRVALNVMRHLAFACCCSYFGNPGGGGPVAIGHALSGSTLSQKGIEQELQVEMKGAASSRQTAHNKALSASPRGSGNRLRGSVLALSLLPAGRQVALADGRCWGGSKCARRTALRTHF